MIMEFITDKYPCSIKPEEMKTFIEKSVESSQIELKNTDVLKTLFSCFDLTSLNTEDSADSIREFVDKVNMHGKKVFSELITK